ncbi:hypothetical protein CVT25_009964, partial [Psilocybe cyanescens]
LVKLSIQYSSLDHLSWIAALILYDYALTWTREVNYFWRRSFTFTTALYIACRYALVSNILFTLALNDKFPAERNHSDEINRPDYYRHSYLVGTYSCDLVYKICSGLSVIGRSAIVVVWGARTYAVYNGNRHILLVFIPLGLLIISLDAVHVKWVTCVGSSGNAKCVCYFAASLLLSIFMVLYEVISALLTSVRSWKALRVIWTRDQDKKPRRQSLMEIVMREDRAARVNFSGSIERSYSTQDPMSRISGVMTARFLLHLRDWEFKRSGQLELDRTTIQFGRNERAMESTKFLTGEEFGEDPVLRVIREQVPAEANFIPHLPREPSEVTV